jgi:hypothetical protein
VLVVVTLVGGVPVPVVDVIHMFVVAHGFMTAAFGVHVSVFVMGEMRQVVLVIVAFMRGMRVPLVDVVNVTLMRGGGVPALRAVHVFVPGMSIVTGSHGSWSPNLCDRVSRLIPMRSLR